MWQPIETAPRDGTFILAKASGGMGKDSKSFIPVVVARKIEGKNEWWARDVDEDYFPGRSDEHWHLDLWMPLPISETRNPYYRLCSNL